MSAFELCVECGTPVGDVGHQAHEDCNRFLDGFCRCSGWLCSRCCPDPECSPLAAALLVAREDVRARAEAEMVATERAEQVAG